MTLLSPTVCLEFLTCSRQFAYRRLGHLSLVLPPTHLLAIQARNFIEQITKQILNYVFHKIDMKTPPPTTSVNKILDAHYKLGQFSFSTFLSELEEQVYTFFLWFFHHFYLAEEINRVDSPIKVYERIVAPSLGYVGQPSAVFTYSDQSVLILIQTYRPTVPFNDAGLQAAVYERILTSQGHTVRHFLFVNYQTSELIFHGVTSRDYSILDATLKRMEASILERDYAPSIDPPCQSCEFEILCST